MSTWDADSDLSRYNRAPAGSWHPLPAEFLNVLGFGLDIAAESQGACDPTAGALVNLWGFGPTGRYNESDFGMPSNAAIAAALQWRGWQRVELDRSAQRVYQPGNLTLDLSAIAKGFGVDEVARHLHRVGVDHFLVDVGGELRGAGMKPDGQPWWVELERPTMPPGETATALPVTRIAVHGLSVATSGDYHQCFEKAQARYCHCIDPRDGKPISNGVSSVSVLHSQCMAADAYSTALMVMGSADGAAFAERHKLAAVIIYRTAGGYAEYLSPAARAMAVSGRHL